MKTGTCLRPSWTAIVCPTISGKIVDVRDQVRIICLLPDSFIRLMRPISRSSTNGPFFELLLNGFSYERSDVETSHGENAQHFHRLSFPRLRARTINLSDSLCLRRVRLPSVGTPHGVTGWRPPFDLPSPPPCGWSTGFIAEPRTDGRLPFQRLRPARPQSMLGWWRCRPGPTVARRIGGTQTIPPGGGASAGKPASSPRSG